MININSLMAKKKDSKNVKVFNGKEASFKIEMPEDEAFKSDKRGQFMSKLKSE